MPRQLVKDNAAEADLIGIWLYSFENWGEAQADRYLDLLELALGTLVKNPRAGKERHVLRPGYWSLRVEHHVVFYTFTDHELRIRRVLHEAMDPGSHVGP